MCPRLRRINLSTTLLFFNIIKLNIRPELGLSGFELLGPGSGPGSKDGGGTTAARLEIKGSEIAGSCFYLILMNSAPSDACGNHAPQIQLQSEGPPMAVSSSLVK